MTEAQWLSEQRNPQGMVVALRGTKVTRTKAGKRKLRLFACACCRLTWEMLHAPLRRCVEVTERFAEGRAGKEDLAKAYESARGAPEPPDDRARAAAGMVWKAAHPQAFSPAFYMTAYP